jgi:hypothetical protein
VFVFAAPVSDFRILQQLNPGRSHPRERRFCLAKGNVLPNALNVRSN